MALPTITDLVQLEYENKRLDERINQHLMGQSVSVKELSESQLRDVYLGRLRKVINNHLEFRELKSNP